MRGKTGTTPCRFICPSSAICRSLLCLLFVLVTGSSSDNPELEYQLAVLRAVDGVTGVSIFGVEGRDKQHGINLYIRASPGVPRKQIRVCGLRTRQANQAPSRARRQAARRSCPRQRRPRGGGGACAPCEVLRSQLFADP